MTYHITSKLWMVYQIEERYFDKSLVELQEV